MFQNREDRLKILRKKLLERGYIDLFDDLRLTTAELEQLLKPETAMEEEMADRHRDIEREFDTGLKRSIWQMLLSSIVLFIIIDFMFPQYLQIAEVGRYSLAIPFVLFAIVIVQLYRLRKKCDLKHVAADQYQK